ncbi:hypothetical protein HN51_043190 [Arachis hypogaea]
MGSRETASASVDDGGTKPMMMEGWLYLIQSNCVGLQFLRKHYFVLKGHHLRSYKYLLALSRNNNNHQLLPLRSAVLDSTIRVLDKGRETIKIEKCFSCSPFTASQHFQSQQSIKDNFFTFSSFFPFIFLKAI